MPEAAEPTSWFEPPVIEGDLIRIEPLTMEHAEGYLAATGGGDEAERTYRWLTRNPPAGIDDARAEIGAALEARGRGERLAMAQVDAGDGTLAGTTSMYEIDPARRSLAIGYTWLGRRWQRTGHNTESKLLLLTHAFERLGAVRVVWHTDIFNLRSQRAIERIGAAREGILRKHKQRSDGSWRDTVQYAMVDDDWPRARDRLRARLDRG